MSLSLYDLENGKADKILASTLQDGLMSKEDKLKLEGLQNYTHPETHAVTMITGLATVATTGNYEHLINKPMIPTSLPANGGNADTLDSFHSSDFMTFAGGTITGELSLTDNNVKLKRIVNSVWIESANQFAIATGRMGAYIANNCYWNGSSWAKYELSQIGNYITVNNAGIQYVTALANTNMEGANSYNIWHAGNHGSGSMLDADLLDGKHANEFATTNTATTTSDGLMSSTDKVKLNGLSNYVHPISHPAMMIEIDVNNFSGNLNYNAYNVQELANIIDALKIDISSDTMRKVRNGGI